MCYLATLRKTEERKESRDEPRKSKPAIKVMGLSRPILQLYSCTDMLCNSDISKYDGTGYKQRAIQDERQTRWSRMISV